MKHIAFLLCFAFPLQGNSQELFDVRKHLEFELGRTPYVLYERQVPVERKTCVGTGQRRPCGVGEGAFFALSSDTNSDSVGLLCFSDHDCSIETTMVVERYKAHAKLKDWHFIEISDFTVDLGKIVSLPKQVFVRTLTAKNCDKASKLRVSKNLSISVTHGVNSSVQRGVRSITAISANVSYKHPKGFGTSLGTQITTAVSMTKTEGTNSSNKHTETESVAAEVMPMRELRWQMLVYQYSMSVPFSGTALVEGRLEENLDKIHFASHFLSPSARTILLEGRLDVTAASGSKMVQFGRALTKEECFEEGTSIIETSQTDYPSGVTSTLIKENDLLATFSNAGGKAKPISLFENYTGFSGGLCYVAPCDSPPDGTRYTCYFDDEELCADCGWEDDPVCLSPPQTE